MPNSAIPESNGTGRLSCRGAPRPAPLHHRAGKVQMMVGLYSQLDERRGSGQEEWRRHFHLSGESFRLPGSIETQDANDNPNNDAYYLDGG